MTISLKRTVRALGLLALILASLSVAMAQSATSRIVNTANSFLATLDQKQKQAVLFAYDDEKQRVRWSNLPVQITKRAGLSMGELSAAQRSAAMALVAAALSKRGFEKVQQIVDADETLKHNEGNNPMFGKDLYYISNSGNSFRQRSLDAAIRWSPSGREHHDCRSRKRGILTPTLTGAQPALYTANGKTIRPLGQESDKAVALLNALDEGQKKQAILSYRLADLVLGPGQDGKTIQPEGLKASSMTEKQRAMLLDVVAEWADIVHESAASARMAELKAEVNDMWFAWSGPVTVTPGNNIAAYYRIQGPHVVIEYAPQRMGNDPSLHVHTMYRDPTNDYGRKPAAK